MDTLEPGGSYVGITSTLASTVEVEFDVPWSEQSDTETVNPVEFWLELMPSASETDPD
jgi:hypothetical protein